MNVHNDSNDSSSDHGINDGCLKLCCMISSYFKLLSNQINDDDDNFEIMK